MKKNKNRIKTVSKPYQNRSFGRPVHMMPFVAPAVHEKKKKVANALAAFFSCWLQVPKKGMGGRANQMNGFDTVLIWF